MKQQYTHKPAGCSMLLYTGMLALVSFLSATDTAAQSTEFRYRIKIRPRHIIYKQVKYTDTVKVSARTEITSKQIVTEDETEFTFTHKDTVLKDSAITYTAKKAKKLSYPLTGKASINIDEKEASVLHVNYWTEFTKVKAGTILYLRSGKSFIKRTLPHDTILQMSGPGITTVLPETHTLSGERKHHTDTTQDWYAVADTMGYIVDASGAITYLKKKYQDNPNYSMVLKNREFVSFPFAMWQLSAFTMPFKYRFPAKRAGVQLDDELVTDISANVFIGKSIGRLKYSYIKGETNTFKKSYVTLGCFAGFSSVSLDSANTFTSETPLKKAKNVAVFNSGGGVIFNIRDFNLGVFAGWDFAMGKEASKWIYSGKPYIGFGLGYKLSFLGKTN